MTFYCGKCKRSLWRSDGGYFRSLSCPFCGTKNRFCAPCQEVFGDIQEELSEESTDGDSACNPPFLTQIRLAARV